MLIPATSAMVSKLVPAVILATAAARLAVSGAYELTGSSAWEIGVGWGGVALGILALYGALAIQLEDVLGTSVLPVGRIGQGRAAIRGTPARQTSGLEHEAGVRQQL